MYDFKYHSSKLISSVVLFTFDSEQYSSENTDNSVVNRYKLKASSTQKEMRYICKECGKQIKSQSNLYAHMRAVHEGIKYPCEQCDYQATSKRNLAQHRRAVHEGIKYPCGQCQHEATTQVRDFLLMLLDADIAHKETLFLHEQLFCVVQDLFLMYMDVDIVHMDILFLYE